MTLLELTLVILMMLSLIGILAIGARTWKKGTDRSICIMNLQAVQKGVRSFSNMYGYEPGASVSGLQGQVIGAGRFVERAPLCPSDGTYASGGDVIPSRGSLYFNCSLAGTGEHQPSGIEDW
ncbi:type II secretion system protein [Luteolibacter sp. Populi]|uniref:type II secretion system protein n=1 Tax=Luteolibacter sp. Populi TaxID=3230487 RepID=UPI0034674983